MAKFRAEQPVGVEIKNNQVSVTLADGRIISNPLDWHPWLKNATPVQQSNVELWVFSIWWPDLDEGLDIEGMIRNIPSHLISIVSTTPDNIPVGIYSSLKEVSPSLIIYSKPESVSTFQVVSMPGFSTNLASSSTIGTRAINPREWIQQ